MLDFVTTQFKERGMAILDSSESEGNSKQVLTREEKQTTEKRELVVEVDSIDTV